jgi:hypothetical protein
MKKRRAQSNGEVTGEVLAVDKIEFVPHAGRRPIYKELYERVSKLKPGHAYVVDVPTGRDPKSYRVSVGNSLANLAKRDGIAISTRLTTSGKIAVGLAEARKARKAKK